MAVDVTTVVGVGRSKHSQALDMSSERNSWRNGGMSTRLRISLAFASLFFAPSFSVKTVTVVTANEVVNMVEVVVDIVDVMVFVPVVSVTVSGEYLCVARVRY